LASRRLHIALLDVRPAPRGRSGIVADVIAIINANDTVSQLLYLVHILSAIAAFGPLFLYPRMQRAGETQAVAALHMKLVFPALILMWVAGMGMAGTQKISLGGTWFVTGTIALWLVAVVVSWFLIRPSISDTSEQARKMMAAGIGITHLILVVSLYLMIFKPGGYEFNS
jgi:hypothetical protein